MSRRRSLSIPETWAAVATVYDDAAARNPALSTDLRLMSAARSRIELSGHSHWRRGELRLLLSKANMTTGELTPLSASALKRAIGRMVEAGMLQAGSWSECLVHPIFAVQTGRKDAKSPCPTRPQGGFGQVAA
ncbi:hypothetical protein ACWFNE_15040 [Cellulomonas sp. NPDC055163]